MYPLAVHHIEMAAAGELRTVGLEAVLERQSGRYETAHWLSEEGRERAVRTVCEACVREPAWSRSVSLTPGSIPCPEPCSVLVSFCREAALWERDRPDACEPDPGVGFADFERAGNALREAFLRTAG